MGRGKPFYNSEFHVVYNADQRFGLDRVYTYHWQGAIHGQQAALSWHWHHGEWNASLVRNTRYRPNVCFTIGCASHDLNRFAEEVVALWQQHAEVALVNSRASLIQSADPYVYDAVTLYNALTHLGLVVEVLTERQLAAGVPERFKTVVCPAGACLPPDAFDGLARFASRGGALVLGEASLAKDCWYGDNGVPLSALPAGRVHRVTGDRNTVDYARQLRTVLTQQNIHLPVTRAKSAEKHTVELRTAVCNGRRIIYLCNMSEEPCRTELEPAEFTAINLLNGAECANQLTLPPWRPFLLETSDVDLERLQLSLE